MAPPVLLLGPLAGLLLLSRPRTSREWFWVLGTLGLTALWLNQTGGLATQFVRAGAVLLTGAFLAMTAWSPSARFSRTLSAVAIAGIALMVWMWHLGIAWGEVQRAVEHDLWNYNRALLMRLSETTRSSTGQTSLLDEMSGMVRSIGALYPALLTLAGLGGLRLAWSWNHRIARHPIGPAPTPFARFGFSDQLVWGWVMGLALALLPLPPMARSVGANLLLVLAALYAVRGLAVFWAGSGRVPRPVIAAVGIVAMVLLPFVLGGLTLLGLADTWLDFRRRLAASAT
jgi:Predicted membrane protein (DUF2232)